MIDLDTLLPEANRRYMCWFLLIAFVAISVLLAVVGDQAVRLALIGAWGGGLTILLNAYFKSKRDEAVNAAKVKAQLAPPAPGGAA